MPDNPGQTELTLMQILNPTARTIALPVPTSVAGESEKQFAMAEGKIHLRASS